MPGGGYCDAVTGAMPMRPAVLRRAGVRAELLDVMSGDFVEAMRARGPSERSIVYRHAFRNMLGPVPRSSRRCWAR